ncbi:hypothetical protein H0O03_02030 [Candidatus Micrarchaeota archaeon]|nr:hypothetical protein [Candidatus Micrarchaeota archaeon]
MKENTYLIIFAVGIAAVVFLSATIFSKSMLPRDYDVLNNVTVYGGGLTAIGNSLTPAKLSVQAMFPDENTPFPCMIKTWTETSRAIGGAYKEVENLANINGEYCLGENNTHKTCPPANVLIRQGDCNCIRAYPENKTVEVIGDDSFYCANETSVRIGEIFRVALTAG